MATKVVVELTGDEQRLINSFRKAEAADEKLRASLKLTSDTAGKDFTNAFIKGGRESAKSLTKLEAKSKTAFANISKSAAKQLAGIGVAYFGIEQGISVVTDALREQQEVLKRSADAHRTLASAQQEAFKNLSTLPSDARTNLLESFVPGLAREAAFPDLVNLTKAVGDAQSAGAESIEQLKNAVRAAAKLTVNTTEFVDETAAALVDAARATGNVDARQNASQIFLVGAQSRIVDPAKLFRNVSPVQIAASIAAGDQRRAEGAQEGGALFAALTRVGADPQGDASQTAAVQFIQRVDEFFEGIEKDSSIARKGFKAFQSDPLSEPQRARFEQLSKASDLSAEDSAELKSMTQTIADSNERLKEQAKNLEALLQKIPETPAEQLEAFKRVPQLGELFLSDKFGEQRFRPGFAQLVRGGAAFEDFQKTLGLLRAQSGSTALFEEKVTEFRGSTAAQEQARLQREQEANARVRESFDTFGASVGSTREFIRDTLARNRSSSGANFLKEALSDALRFPTFGGIKGREGIEELTRGIVLFKRRINSIRDDGLTASEVPRVRELQGAIEAALSRIRSRATLSEEPEVLRRQRKQIADSAVFLRSDEDIQLNRRMVEALDAMIKLQKEMLDEEKRTAKNTEPLPPRTTEAMQSANEAANRRRQN